MPQTVTDSLLNARDSARYDTRPWGLEKMTLGGEGEEDKIGLLYTQSHILNRNLSPVLLSLVILEFEG